MLQQALAVENEPPVLDDTGAEAAIDRFDELHVLLADDAPAG